MPRMIYRVLFCALTLFFLTEKIKAQYATTHYIAPAPWQYWNNGNELVFSTVAVGTVNVTVSRSNGTVEASTTVVAGTPTVIRLAGSVATSNANPINTVLNDRGLIITASAPVGVNVRNVESDQVGGGNAAQMKGNASLSSFGDQGVGTAFRLAYYRSNFSGLNIGGPATGFTVGQPVYSVMALENNTIVTFNGAPLATLNAGESYLFQTNIQGGLLSSNRPVVSNAGAWQDAPGGCGDGVYNQVPPLQVLGNDYMVVRGSGTAGLNTIFPEQTTVVATAPGTTITITNYNNAGVQVSTSTVPLANAGDVHTFFHGDAANAFSTSFIVSDQPVAVYSGTAQGCEVDMITVPPIGGCTGSFNIETFKFRELNNADLPYFGFVLLQSAVDVVTLNGTNMEVLTGQPRFQIGTTGFYLFQFTNATIGNPNNIILSSTARMSCAIVQQGGGFSMSAFFSSFNETPAPPSVAGAGGTCGNVTLTAEPGLAPYQWFLDGVAIPGATNQTYSPSSPGNFSVQGTRLCGTTAPSAPVFVNCVASCPTGYEPSPVSIITNGNFAVQGGPLGGGVTCAQNPTLTAGTLNATSGFFSQAAHCADGPGNRAFDGCFGGGRNHYNLMDGDYALNNFGFNDRINDFPGDPGNNVAPSTTYFYSNGNCFNGGEYLLWGQQVSGLIVGRTYTFFAYVNNAIEPPGAPDDPIFRLRVGGAVDLPNGTVVAGPITLTEALTAFAQPLEGWVRVAYTFTATNTTEIFKVSSASTGSVGDDFQFTAVGVVQCRPLVVATSNTPVCAGAMLNLTASTPAAGVFTYNWNGPNGFTATGATPSLPNFAAINAGVYSVTITDANGVTNSASTTVAGLVTPTVTISGTNTVCAGQSSVFTASGTNTYLWSTGEATPSITVNTASTFTVTGTAANGCTASASLALTLNPNPSIAGVVPTNPACPFPFNDGSIAINASITGPGAMEYSINGGTSFQPASTFSGLSAGSYTVQVRGQGTPCATTFVGNPVTLVAPVCAEICNDGVDNDGNALTDCADPVCQLTLTLSYAGPTFCVNGTNPTPTFSPAGGAFSSLPAGLALNSATGEIDLSASTPGNYTVSYTVLPTAANCGGTVTTNVNITQAPNSPGGIIRN